MKQAPYSTKNSGFTLVELLIAVALASFVSIALVTSFTAFTRAQTVQDNIIGLQQNVRAALYFMGREFRMAGYNGPNPDATDARIINANSNYFSFSILADNDATDNDGDGNTDEVGETSQFIYEHYDSDGDGNNDAIGRTVDSGTRAPVAEEIEELEFIYVVENGGTRSFNANPAALDKIVGVMISILARTVRSDPDFDNSQTFTTPLATSWGPYTDGRRRRLTQTAIWFRNL